MNTKQSIRPMKMTFEQIQSNLKGWMGRTVKPGTKVGYMLEQTYIRGLQDGGVEIPAIVTMLVMSGRSIVEFSEK